MAFGVWRYGVWRLAFGVWRYGVWRLAFGVMAKGIERILFTPELTIRQYRILGTFHLNPSIPSVHRHYSSVQRKNFQNLSCH
jgi:hypothetical protein